MATFDFSKAAAVITTSPEPILDATGEIKICTYHPGKQKFSFGNIYEKSFADIWRGEQRQKSINFVRRVKYDKICQMCCKCSEVNKLIDYLTHPEEMVDVNFI
jgi:radical SAM protein with 4Fe4S-binding SPASM domain